MSKTFLITRPKSDADAVAEALLARGFRIVHEPLMEIVPRPAMQQPLEQALLAEPDAVIITSRNGARALAALTSSRDVSLVCVGRATEEAAKSLGFTRSVAAGGTARQLVDYLSAAYDKGSRFLYASGFHARVDIAAALAARGMEAERIALYEAVAAERLSDTLVERLKRGQIDAAAFFSPRAAQIFCRLLAAAGLQSATIAMDALCLSPAVARMLADMRWRSVRAALEPTLASLLQCVDNVLHG